MATAKTAVQVEAEIRALWNKFYAAADEKGSLAEHLMSRIMDAIGDKEIEYLLEQAEDDKLLEEAQAEALATAQAYATFHYNISISLTNHKTALLNIFNKNPEFKDAVFAGTEAQKNEQAQAYVEERAEKAEETLTKFSKDAEEFNEILTNIDKQTGDKAIALGLISRAFDEALKCQQVDFSSLQESIAALKAEMKAYPEQTAAIQQKIYNVFASATEQMDKDVYEDLKQKLEQIVTDKVIASAIEKLRGNDSKVADFVAGCGLHYCTAEGAEVKLTNKESIQMVEFCTARAIDNNYSLNQGDKCRQERLNFINKLCNSDSKALLEIVTPELQKLQPNAQVFVTGLTDVKKRFNEQNPKVKSVEIPEAITQAFKDIEVKSSQVISANTKNDPFTLAVEATRQKGGDGISHNDVKSLVKDFAGKVKFSATLSSDGNQSVKLQGINRVAELFFNKDGEVKTRGN